MNANEKVVQAILAYERCVAATVQAQTATTKAASAEESAKSELARILRATYGDRATAGVMFGRKLYRATNETDERGRPLAIEVEGVQFEVLFDGPRSPA